MVFGVDTDLIKKVLEIKTRRMRGIDFGGCSTDLRSGDYLELSITWFILRHTKGNYVYEEYVRTEHTQYFDAPPNPPVMPSETRGTVRTSTEGVATWVEYEVEVFPTVGIDVNYPIMNVWYGFSKKNVKMGRYTTKWKYRWVVANWLKPNPASVVV